MAIPGPLTPSKNGSYSSSLEFAGTTFTATYVFDDPAVAQVAGNSFLGERLMSWQVVDLAGNRQGLTIAERGEVGGPGFGGCPNGPLGSGPPAPSNVVAVNVAGGVKLTWTPATAIPGTPAITGYRVDAVSQTVSPTSEQVEFGKRIANPAATGTTITGLSATDNYNLEVVSVNSVGQTLPARGDPAGDRRHTTDGLCNSARRELRGAAECGAVRQRGRVADLLHHRRDRPCRG